MAKHKHKYYDATKITTVLMYTYTHSEARACSGGPYEFSIWPAMNYYLGVSLSKTFEIMVRYYYYYR